MAHWKEHCRDCETVLGKSWDVVHHWLDEYAKIYWPSKLHRLHRHHAEGVEEVRQKWGNEAAAAAEIHILKDEGSIMSEEELRTKYDKIIQDAKEKSKQR